MTTVPAINKSLHRYFFVSIIFISPLFSFSQIDTSHYIVIEASKNYEKRASYQKKWGEHYRKEWATPVKFKKVMLDTLAGGLTPYDAGGGRQSKSLRLKDKQGREYVLRSVDKSFGKALPEIYQGTFFEDIINDQVTIGHPYAALVIPTLADAAGVYHTTPQIIFIPSQPALDSFNKDFGNQLYLFEQRPDENWETAPNFGNSKNIVGTEKMLSEINEDNDHSVDQISYVRARLFDFLIGDWGRHEDQWRWASFKNGDEKIYKPVPRDRDQAFTKFDGTWLKLGISAGDLGHLQSYDKNEPDIKTFNFTARNLDRRLVTGLSLQQWIDIAKGMQRSVSDAVIAKAVKQLPPEVANISANEITAGLKTRRDRLVESAIDYYKFLAKDVDVVGSDKKELFEVHRLNDNETLVKVYKLKTIGDSTDKLIYERKFNTSETQEIRLYGMGDDDVFKLDGRVNKGILVRVVGGNGNDVLEDKSFVSGGKKLTQVYDNDKTGFQTSGETRLRISDDSVMNSYQYKSFEYDKKGFGVKPGFFSLTLGWDETIHGWKKDPARKQQNIKVKYSINKQALYIDYKTTFYQLLGKWNGFIAAGAGVPNVVNFFGVGNETKFETYDRKFFRLRSIEYYGKLGVNRIIGNSQIEFDGFYQTIKIKPDSTRIISKIAQTEDGYSDLSRKHFVGAELTYKYQNTDNPVIPSKGFRFNTSAKYTYNLSKPDHSFTRLSSDASVYIPIIKFISLGIRAGGTANIGHAEFYQLNILGSHDNLRGFRKYRFYGKQMAYNNNELRFMFDAHNKVFNGKYGFITFYDQGRVWYPGENSNIWHSGYGAGAFVSLFNKIVSSGTYGISKEDKVISFYVGFYF
jgi:hypothetical protein